MGQLFLLSLRQLWIVVEQALQAQSVEGFPIQHAWLARTVPLQAKGHNYIWISLCLWGLALADGRDISGPHFGHTPLFTLCGHEWTQFCQDTNCVWNCWTSSSHGFHDFCHFDSHYGQRSGNKVSWVNQKEETNHWQGVNQSESKQRDKKEWMNNN